MNFNKNLINIVLAVFNENILFFLNLSKIMNKMNKNGRCRQIFQSFGPDLCGRWS